MIFGISVENTGDILNLTLAGGFLLLILVLILVLLRAYKILGNVHRVTENIEEISEIVKHYLWQPVKLGAKAFNAIKKFLKKRK